ncbi:septum formation family protein [Embleya sp. NBC_00896]|uniref:septum formation family protein n=1 Tax=Embleya sp. NBC_00896 TaxID=2975961 RepID=UPI0038698F6C|nr:septum formation family protein [Embleya sp. NBC_00896]
MRVSRSSGVVSPARAGRRRALARSSAAVVSALVASTLLTGCLGDKKDDKSSDAPASKSPVITMPPAPTLPAKVDPSASNAPGGGAATPSGASTPRKGQVKLVKLKKGDCINEDGVEVDIVSCTTPHKAEVIDVFVLPNTMSPTSMTFQDDTGKKCTELITPTAARNSALPLSKLTYRPTPGSWIDENDRELTCLLTRVDKVPLTAPLK